MSCVPPAVNNWSVLPLYWHELLEPVQGGARKRKNCCHIFRFDEGKSVC